MDCTNRNCPAYAKCLAPYRGSRCKATRATYGLGDPITNADRIRAMSDEELAEIFANNDCGYCRIHDFCFAKGSAINCEDVWLDWLRQEAKDA